MKLVIENNHVPKNNRYRSVIVEDQVKNLVFLYDNCGAFTQLVRNRVAPGAEDDQTLTLTGTVLSIDGGNSVDLGPIIPEIDPGGGVIAPDNQQLSLNGNILSLERGGSVDLTSVVGTGGGSSAPLSIIETSSNYTITDANDVLLVRSGGVTVSIPSASTARKRAVTIKNKATTNIYFQTTVTNQTVDEVASSIIVPDQALTIVPSGNNWHII